MRNRLLRGGNARQHAIRKSHFSSTSRTCMQSVMSVMLPESTGRPKFTCSERSRFSSSSTSRKQSNMNQNQCQCLQSCHIAGHCQPATQSIVPAARHHVLAGTGMAYGTPRQDHRKAGKINVRLLGRAIDLCNLESQAVRFVTVRVPCTVLATKARVDGAPCVSRFEYRGRKHDGAVCSPKIFSFRTRPVPVEATVA